MEEVSNTYVEESTEPPIRGSHHDIEKQTPSKELPLTEAKATTADVNHAGKSEPVVEPSAAPTDLSEIWAEEYKYSHTYSAQTVAQVLRTDIQHGLTAAEAASRLERDGLNKVETDKGTSLLGIFLRQVSNSLTIVLVITMGLSFGIHDYIEGGVIAAVISLNVVVGFFQDYRAEQQIASLRALAPPTAMVLRNGISEKIKAETLVVGDIVQIHMGDTIPADLRLISGMNISASEMHLTGESKPINKNPEAVYTEREMPTGDRKNMAYAGAMMCAGRATGIVIAVGMKTQMGNIATLMGDQSKSDKEMSRNPVIRALFAVKDFGKKILGLIGTPLQVKLSKFALLLFALAITLAIIVFSASKWNVSDEVLIYGICVAVAVIPESLIAVLTITMAVGSKAMSKGNVIVRNLQALEAVGGVTNICSDKTGTLTQGKMIARKAWIRGAGILSVHDSTSAFDPTNGRAKLNDQDFNLDELDEKAEVANFFSAITLCNLSQVAQEVRDQESSKPATWLGVGEPTEVALNVLARRVGFEKAAIIESDGLRQIAEFPFDSGVKRMTVVYESSNRTVIAHTKGATEVLLPLMNVDEATKSEILANVEAMAGEGLRVLCVAHRVLPVDDNSQTLVRGDVEIELHFDGLVGIYDPPRVETAGAVRKCQMAGIAVHMLTGDHIKTATAIAYEVGILGPHMPSAIAGTAIMPASVFDKLSDEEIDAMESLPLVLARCSPATKVRMVDAMHRRHAFCVMTGDGVNDAPSLKRAHVGIAMGQAGSDVAKDAADMVLADDNFASIVKAIEEGRRLFDNIQKFLMHLLISNISQVILLLIGLAFKDGENLSVFPLSPLEILWVNLITSSFLAVGLGLEEAQADVMYRPPHNLRVGVFTRELITDKFIYGFFMGSLCLVAFVSVAYGAGDGDLGRDCNNGWNETCDVVFRARSTVYATLTWLLLVTAWEVKHFSRSLFNLNPAIHSGPFSIFPTIWANRFLFWAVIAGFVISFPVVYLPVVNETVFKHKDLTWEWGVVVGCLVVYVALVESWKAVKRRFGIGSGKNAVLTREDAELRVGLAPEEIRGVSRGGESVISGITEMNSEGTLEANKEKGGK